MRKIAIVGIAVLLGAAALLIPSGAQGAPTNNSRYTVSVSSPITVTCTAGEQGDLGSASYTVSISSVESGGTRVLGSPDEIRVFRGAEQVAILDTNPDSATVTEEDFPCPVSGAAADNGTAVFTFTQYKNGASNGTSTTTNATTQRDGSSS